MDHNDAILYYLNGVYQVTEEQSMQESVCRVHYEAKQNLETFSALSYSRRGVKKKQ